MLQPALLGGVVIGVLSALPVVNLVNICCCGWVLFGGGMAAWLMQQQRPQPISVGDGALVGLMAGAIGAVVSTVVSIPINATMMPFQAGMLDQALSNAGDMPPEARAFLESLRGGTLAGVASVFAFMLSLVVFSVFGLVGGLFGALFFKKPAPPSLPSDPGASAWQAPSAQPGNPSTPAWQVPPPLPDDPGTPARPAQPSPVPPPPPPPDTD